jgi:hypothetical protein
MENLPPLCKYFGCKFLIVKMLHDILADGHGTEEVSHLRSGGFLRMQLKPKGDRSDVEADCLHCLWIRRVTVQFGKQSLERRLPEDSGRSVDS